MVAPLLGNLLCAGSWVDTHAWTEDVEISTDVLPTAALPPCRGGMTAVRDKFPHVSLSLRFFPFACGERVCRVLIACAILSLGFENSELLKVTSVPGYEPRKSRRKVPRYCFKFRGKRTQKAIFKKMNPQKLENNSKNNLETMGLAIDTPADRTGAAAAMDRRISYRVPFSAPPPLP